MNIQMNRQTNEQMNGQIDRLLTDEEFRKLNKRQKLQYLWKFKRKHMVMFIVEIGVIILLLIALGVKNGRTLTGVLLNSSDDIPISVLLEVKDDLLEGAQLEKGKADAELLNGLIYYTSEEDEAKAENNLYLVQELAKQSEKGKVDFLFGDQESVVILAYAGFFQDLSNVLSEKQLEQYKPYLRYIDSAVVETIAQAVEEKVSVEIVIPDCAKPDEMEKPVPVMVDVSHYGKLDVLYPDMEVPVLFGIFEKMPAEGVAQRLIGYLVEG